VTEGPDRRAPTESALTLGVLDAQAQRVRAELAALSSTLATVQQEFGDDRISHLLAANEQLVRAALLADSIAEKALMSLASLTHERSLDSTVDAAAVASRTQQLEAALAMARRRQTRLAVVAIRLDASCDSDGRPGRAAGAPVMQAAARRLEAALRRADTVCLQDGDPALLLLVEVARAGDAALVATKAVALLAAPVRVDGRDLRLTASVGIAVYPVDGAQAGRLIELAEAAMRRAAQRATGGIEFAGVHPDLTEAPQFAPEVLPASLPRPGLPLQNLRDVNERLVIAAVQAQQQQVDSQDRARELQVRFLAMVAHELRNPLMPIRTAAELLLRARGDDTMMQRLQGVIQRQVAQMSRLVDDLLDTSRITSGRFRLERATVDLATVLATARDSCQPAIESRLQLLEWAVTPEPILVEGDAVRLAQVFCNLLDNASKYTPRGGRLRVATSATETGVAIEVSDEGRGISATAMPHIFDLFAQDPRTIAFGNGGLGIGLAVVRELVDAHGGSIVARSAGVDRGSAFIVSLPRALAPAVV
jgi:diguanylate cyclase (GGDEF)-like protein